MPRMARRITVDILTGFLGSGKTTLLNRLLVTPGFGNVAVVVNELGEIGLDHLLVEQRSDQIALLEGGCLCCAVVDSLPETLLELCRKRAGGELPAFDRIVIETTGLADPGPIAEVIRRSPLLAHFLVPGIVVTALDASGRWDAVERHPEATAQLVLADRIILTKLDLRDAWDETDEQRLRALNPFAEIVDAFAIVADSGRLVAPVPALAPRPPAAPARHSHGVEAQYFAVAGEVTRAGLAALAGALAHRLGVRLLRCKGVLRVAGRAILVQGVGARFHFADAPASAVSAPSGLTCIVQHVQPEEIETLLRWLFVPEGTQPPAPEDL